jgi:HAD superfamily hydrolase (TIGR01509 family)
MKIQALIFDVDGTLADTEEAHRCAFNEAFELHGLAWHWSRAEYAHLLKITGGRERLAFFIESMQLRSNKRQSLNGRIAEIHQSKTEIYARLIRGGQVPLRDGVSRLMDEAESAGVRLAIASTTTRENIDALIVTNLGERALERFSVIGAGDAVSRKKPAPDIYESVLRSLAVSADECVAIEDSSQGLTAAKRAALFTVVTPSPWTRGEDFSAADVLLGSLGSWARPLMELEHAFSISHNGGWHSSSMASGDV